MLVATLFALITVPQRESSSTYDDFAKYLRLEDSQWKIAGCEIGMRSSKVVATLGKPYKKSGELATSKESDAEFYVKDSNGKSRIVFIFFSRGRLTYISAGSDFGGTTLPKLGTTIGDVTSVLGEPDQGSSGKVFTYHKGLITIFLENEKVSRYELSLAKRALYVLREAEKASPSYKLILRESQSSTSYSKDDPTRILSATTTGIVENKRDVRTEVRIRVIFRDKKGRFVGAGETTISVDSKESKIFSFETYNVSGDARTNTYEIELAAVGS
jgi:hypothetical protein